jgi:hypothetical protein
LQRIVGVIRTVTCRSLGHLRFLSMRNSREPVASQRSRGRTRSVRRIRHVLIVLSLATSSAAGWSAKESATDGSEFFGSSPPTTSAETTVVQPSRSEAPQRPTIWSSELDDVLPVPHVCVGGKENAYSHNPAYPPSLVRQATTSTGFDIDVLEAPSIAHETAVRYCLSLAEKTWVSSQTVRVLVRFGAFLTDRGADDYTTLGTGQPTRNWLLNGIQMPMALAKAIENKDLNEKLSGTANYDLLINLNTLPDWYLGTDGKTKPLTFDLVTVCLHEAYHGLLVSGNNIDVSYDQEVGGYLAHHIQPTKIGRFDQFMANQDDCNIDGYKFNETLLGAALTSNNLFFVDATRKRIAKLHAPNPYIPGSSLYHLSESEYGAPGNANDLMSPIINMAYSQHNVGDVMLRIQDIMLDMEYQPQAAICKNIDAPVSLADPITQTGGGSGSDREDRTGPGKGRFKIKIGHTELSGWVLVGVGVGALVLIVVLLALGQCARVRRTQSRPEQRMRREEAVAKKGGGNEAGVV